MLKNRTMRIAVLVLALALITSCFIGSTFAKYTSKGTGTSTARVAKWDITTGTDELALSDGAVTFDLFESVNDANVKDGGDAENIIAPGTSGSFALTVNNNSEVTANAAISFTVVNANNIPVEYQVVEGTVAAEEDAWSKDITTLGVNKDLAMENGTVTYTVYWRWAYFVDEATDGTDTTLGLDGTYTVAVTATVTATQVD